MALKPRTAFIYECHYGNADFGEEYVVVEANNKKEADQLIDLWCKTNHCVNSSSPTGNGPKPRLIHSGFLFKKGENPSYFKE